MRNRFKYLIFILPVCLSLTISSCGDGNKVSNPNVGDTLSVLSNLDLLIAEDADNPELYFQRAEYHLEKQNVFSGTADINKAIQLDSTKAKYFNLLSDFNFMTGRIPEVKTNLSNALRLEPENTDALLKYAEFQLYLQDYPLVFENVNKALRINQFLAKGYFLKGMAYTELKDTAMAVSSFQTCVEQDPEYYHAHMQLGLIFSAKNDPICVSYFNNAISVNPEKPEAHYALGYFYQEHGQYGEALMNYDNMLKVSPKNAAALYNKGYINLVYLENYDEAIQWFTEVIKVDPRYADAYYNRGRAYELKGNKSAARQDFENAIRVEPEHKLGTLGLNRLGK
jgi:tetratricopeptide (TPR) repeat protein